MKGRPRISIEKFIKMRTVDASELTPVKGGALAEIKKGDVVNLSEGFSADLRLDIQNLSYVYRRFREYFNNHKKVDEEKNIQQELSELGLIYWFLKGDEKGLNLKRDIP